MGAIDPFTDYSNKPNGFHRPNGIFIANGPGIRQNAVVENISLQDIAPTILYSFDTPIPCDMDGRPLIEIFSPKYVGRRPVKMSERTDSSNRYEDIYSKRESSEIRKRLRSLGYIE